MKLSKAQEAILRRMAARDEHLYENVWHGGSWFNWRYGEAWARGMRHDTVGKLHALGFVERLSVADTDTASWVTADACYAITPAGRKYLEEHDVDSNG